MPARARLESFGQTLVIDNVQSEDAGAYECQGINDEAMIPVRRSFTLSIECETFFILFFRGHYRVKHVCVCICPHVYVRYKQSNGIQHIIVKFTVRFFIYDTITKKGWVHEGR